MKNENLRISDMLEMSYILWEKNKGSWSPMEPEYGRNMILWMMEEVGEAIAVIKKKGDKTIMEDSAVREAFVEELCDVMMYFSDILNRYNISAEEFSKMYVRKFTRNMERDFKKEHNAFLNNSGNK